MTGALQTTTVTVDHAVNRTDPPLISESCSSQQPAWTTTTMRREENEKRREQNLIVRSGKSVAVAEATNNRRLRSTFCTTEANY